MTEELTMATDADESGASITYELTCTDCQYEATVTGDVYDALDVAESHQEKHDEDSNQHFVNVEATEQSGI